MTEIIMLQDDDEQIARFWQLRLDALQNAPEAFGSSYEESAQTPMPELIARQRARMNSENVVFLAKAGEEFVGITGLHRETHLKARHRGLIWGVYVRSEQRGRGLARALMQRAIAYARELDGLELLYLAVATNNMAALRLYQSLGFVTWGTEPMSLNVNGVYLDEHHMTLRL